MSPEKCRVRQKLRQKGGDRQKIKINRCPKEQVEKGKEAQREVCRRDPEKQRSRDSERARENQRGTGTGERQADRPVRQKQEDWHRREGNSESCKDPVQVLVVGEGRGRGEVP